VGASIALVNAMFSMVILIKVHGMPICSSILYMDKIHYLLIGVAIGSRTLHGSHTMPYSVVLAP
jgi:N-formylglutamate amidohydrolase